MNDSPSGRHGHLWVIFVVLAALAATTSCGTADEGRSTTTARTQESCDPPDLDFDVTATQIPITAETIEAAEAGRPVAIAGRRNGDGFFLVERSTSGDLQLRQMDTAGGTEDVTSLGAPATTGHTNYGSGPNVLEDDEGRPVVLWLAEGVDGGKPVLTVSRIDTEDRPSHTEITTLSGERPWLYQLRSGRVTTVVSDGESNVVRAFDLSGSQLWEVPLELNGSPAQQLVSSGDTTIVRLDQSLLAWDIDGELLWERTLPQSWRNVVEVGASSATDPPPAAAMAVVLGDGRSLCLLSDDGAPVGSLHADAGLGDIRVYRLGHLILVLNTVEGTRRSQDMIIVDLEGQSAVKANPGEFLPGDDPYLENEVVLEGRLVIAGRTSQEVAPNSAPEAFISVISP